MQPAESILPPRLAVVHVTDDLAVHHLRGIGPAAAHVDEDGPVLLNVASPRRRSVEVPVSIGDLVENEDGEVAPEQVDQPQRTVGQVRVVLVLGVPRGPRPRLRIVVWLNGLEYELGRSLGVNASRGPGPEVGEALGPVEPGGIATRPRELARQPLLAERDCGRVLVAVVPCLAQGQVPKSIMAGRRCCRPST